MIVLVVDDAEAIRKLICLALEPLGVALIEAGDGRRALEMAREAQPDIVILDAMIPELHGFEVCRAIKGDPALRRARVLMVSAIYTGWKVGADVQANFGADAFLEKPFRIEEAEGRCEISCSRRSARVTPRGSVRVRSLCAPKRQSWQSRGAPTRRWPSS